MKKALLIVLAALMLVTSAVFAEATDGGKVLNIACWNEEFQSRFNDYFAAAGLVPDDVKVNWLITPFLFRTPIRKR